VDENIPSPQEKGDREAVEEVLHGGGVDKHHLKQITFSAIATLGTSGNATGIPR
jgi:hypothetical protein